MCVISVRLGRAGLKRGLDVRFLSTVAFFVQGPDRGHRGEESLQMPVYQDVACQIFAVLWCGMPAAMVKPVEIRWIMDYSQTSEYDEDIENY